MKTFREQQSAKIIVRRPLKKRKTQIRAPTHTGVPQPKVTKQKCKIHSTKYKITNITNKYNARRPHAEVEISEMERDTRTQSYNQTKPRRVSWIWGEMRRGW